MEANMKWMCDTRILYNLIFILISQIEALIKWRNLTFNKDIKTRYDRQIVTNYYQIQGTHESGTKGERG